MKRFAAILIWLTIPLSAQITIPLGTVITEPGTFSTTQSSATLQSNVGGCLPLLNSYSPGNASYYNVQYHPNLTAGIVGCVLRSSGSTGVSSEGVVGLAGSTDTGADLVGGSFYGFALADNVKAFGANPVAQDIAGLMGNVVLIAEELDVQPYNGSGSYADVVGEHIRLFNANGTGAGGTYPGYVMQVSGGGVNASMMPTTAYWGNGIEFLTGSLGSASGAALILQPIAPATSSGNYNPPAILQAQESYYNGSGSTTQTWQLSATEGSGTNPAQDTFTLSNTGGPSGQTHTFNVNNVNVQLTNSSGGVVIKSAPAGNTLLVNQTISGQGIPPVLPSSTILAAASNSGATRTASISYGGDPQFSTVGFGGSSGTPTAITAGTQIADLNAWAYNGTSLNGPIAAFRCFANQTQTTSAGGSYCDIATTPNGSISEAQVIEFQNDAGMTTPGVTGGDKGAGTINAAGLYVNGNAVLTSSPWSAITPGANTQTGAFSTVAPWTFSAGGGASTSAISISGAPFGGTGTTSTPQLLIGDGASSVTSWSTSKTYLGFNAASAFTGNFIDMHVNGGGSTFSVTASGAVNSNNIQAFGTLTSSINNASGGVNIVNTASANSTTCVSPGSLNFKGAYWTGAATAQNTLELTSSCLQSTNGAEFLTVSNVGSSGQLTFAVAGFVQSVPTYTTSTLTPCSMTYKNSEAQVSDAISPTYLGTYTGGGSTYAPVICNGTTWITY